MNCMFFQLLTVLIYIDRVSGMQVMIHLHEQFTLKSLVGTVIALSHTGTHCDYQYNIELLYQV